MACQELAVRLLAEPSAKCHPWLYSDWNGAYPPVESTPEFYITALS